MQSKFWRITAFNLVIIACIQFVVLTVIAIFTYAGGSYDDHSAAGYVFFRNYFSDLGLTVAHNGSANTVSAVLFFIALLLAGLGLALFFLAFPQFFWNRTVGKILSLLGSLVGVFSGICFVGIAFTPANLAGEAHGNFVLWAFEAFMLAVIFYTLAIFLNPDYPKVYGFALLVFAVLLVAYVWLINAGPSGETTQGQIIQVGGQKAIVYASIISVWIQAAGAKKINSRI